VLGEVVGALERRDVEEMALDRRELHAVALQLAHVRLSAPQRRGLGAGRGRRRERADRAEQPADRPLGRPAEHPDRPAGRQTRISSSAAIRWWGANITPIADITASKDSSSNGRCSASASTQASSRPAASARARPASSSSGVRSLAVTRAPASAAGIDALPVPAATSSTRMPGPMPHASTSRGPSGSSHVSTIDG